MGESDPTAPPGQKAVSSAADATRAPAAGVRPGGADGPERPERVETIAGFRILGLLGQGGMGTVYRAEQGEPLRRQVALKVIRGALARGDEQFQARFDAERQALADLNHPHIAQVFAAGTTADGERWYALELIEGLPLTDYLTAHPLPLAQRLALFVEICRAVHFAHQRGILHRDLKPSNLLVREVLGRPVPKIIDFGLAKVLAQAGPEVPPTAVLGTPAYMSPEALEPGLASGGLDARVDVYALGVVLHELVHGQRPAPGVRFRAPAGLDAVLRHALALDRTVRTPSAAALAAEVETWLAGHRRARWRRPRWWVGAAAVVVLLVIAGAAAIWSAGPPWPSTPTPELSPAVPAEAVDAHLRGRLLWNERTEVGVRAALVEFERAVKLAPRWAPGYVGLADCYALLPPYGGISGAVAYPRALAAARRALELDPESVAAHTTLGLVLLEHSWDWPGAERSYRRALELNPGYATAHQWYGELLSRAGRHEEALEHLREAERLDPLSPIVATVYGWALLNARRWDEAAAQLDGVLALDPGFPPARGFRAFVEIARGRPERAIPTLEALVQARPDDVRRHAELGVALARAGRRVEAETVLAHLPPASPAFHRARLLVALGRLEEALDELDRAADEGGVWMLFLRVDPLLDELRGEPRFQELERRVGFALR